LFLKGGKNEEKIHNVEGQERILPKVQQIEEDTQTPQKLPEHYLL
jgi:hypothetical protein